MNAATLVFLVLLGAPRAAELWARAEALEKRAKAAEPARKAAAVEEALRAFGELLEWFPKDRKLVPRARRRRAALLKSVGRVRDAVGEHDRIAKGRASRYDRARALLDGAKLLKGAGDLQAAEARCARVRSEFASEIGLAVRAAMLQARCLERRSRPEKAAVVYRHVVERHHDRVKEAIAAYDALALLEIEAGRFDRARRWLEACARRYEKKTLRRDKFGQYVARLIVGMKSPSRLAEAEAGANGTDAKDQSRGR